MITFHYPLLCHREYQLKQTKLFWCLWSISAGSVLQECYLDFYEWAATSISISSGRWARIRSLHWVQIFNIGRKIPLPEAWKGERGVAYWFWRAGSVIACAQKAVNQECSLLFAYTSGRLLCSSCANAGVWNLDHYTHRLVLHCGIMHWKNASADWQEQLGRGKGQPELIS